MELFLLYYLYIKLFAKSFQKDKDTMQITIAKILCDADWRVNSKLL